MGTKVKHAAPFRIKYNQITGCTRSKVSCGFYRRKPPSQRIDEFAAAIFTPNLEVQRKASERKNVLNGDRKAQKVGGVSGIRRFERGDLHAIAGKLQNSSVRCVPDVNGLTIRHGGKRTRRLLAGIGQDPPYPENSPMAIEDLHPCSCGVRHIDPSVCVDRKS